MNDVIGVDLSLTGTGVIVLRNGKIICEKLIKTKPVEGVLAELHRLREIVEGVMGVVEKPRLAVIEGLAFLAAGHTTAYAQLVGLNYLLRDRLERSGCPFVIVAPSSLKKFVTGKGNAQKNVILMEIYKRWHVSFSNDNLGDAYGLAKIGEGLVAAPKLTQTQVEVVQLLKSQFTVYGQA